MLEIITKPACQVKRQGVI